ncbi:MAG: hypothetical protein SVG88_06530 [Halobacteriales archaeon]|nr:hypothetical protein [Halobacteriales archaeon]
MSTNDTITTVFDMQRSAIEQAQKAFKRTADLQVEASDALESSLEAQKSLQKQSTAMSERLVLSYLDTVASSAPGEEVDVEELKATVEEQFDALDEVQDDTWEAVTNTLEEVESTSESFTDQYVETVDAAFDSFLDAHERVESQMTEAAEAVDIDVESK